MARNYQDIIFGDVQSQEIIYLPQDNTTSPTITERKGILYSAVGDTFDKCALIIGCHAGGGDMYSLKSDANFFVQRGYKFFSIETVDKGTSYDIAAQTQAILNTGCANRWAHALKGQYGFSGRNIFGYGISEGGENIWQANVSFPLSNPMFISPINNVYNRAKMKWLGTVSLPGQCFSDFAALINSSNAPHTDHHGDNDRTMPIGKAQTVIDSMVKVGVASQLIKYKGADHSLTGLHDQILQAILNKFATLMGIPIVVPI